jgi:site-specific DNA recombinase
LSARTERCPRRAVKAAELEEAVWAHIVQLLSDPGALLAQFAQYTQLVPEGDVHERTAAQALATRIARVEREDRRLLDAYQAEVNSLEELKGRRQQLAERRQALLDQQAAQERLRQEQARAQTVLADLTAFCARIQGRLAEATFADKPGQSNSQRGG